MFEVGDRVRVTDEYPGEDERGVEGTFVAFAGDDTPFPFEAHLDGYETAYIFTDGELELMRS